jgi:hypothetical protein
MMSDDVDDRIEENEIRFRKIISDQLTRYPKMEVQDIYKLIHQGAMGSEHVVDDFASAQTWLEKEIANMQPGPDEPVVDPISIHGEIVRINLRPYIKAGGNQSTLLNAFMKTVKEYKGSLEQLMMCWSYFEKMVQRGNLDFSEDEVNDFMDQMSANAFPAVHHSKSYEESYHPAYRVVALSILTGWKQVY